MMHGADRNTPVTLIENASRADQRICPATLGTLAEQADLAGPAVIFIGLAPRAAAAALHDIEQEELANA